MATDNTSPVGFYKWNEIWHAWREGFEHEPNSLIFSALTEYFHPNSLADVNHPLNEVGADGVQLWKGNIYALIHIIQAR
jgi:hypothetical protein